MTESESQEGASFREVPYHQKVPFSWWMPPSWAWIFFWGGGGGGGGWKWRER